MKTVAKLMGEKVKLSKWEAGECLIAAADALWEEERDLRNGGHRKLAAKLKDLRLSIGDVFDELGSHEFGLASHKRSA